MIDPDNPALSVRKQCEILGVHRSSYYRPSTKKRHKDWDEMTSLILKVHEDYPFYGRPRLHQSLLKAGFKVSSYQVKLMMKAHGLEALIPFKRLTKANKQHKKYPYLLKGMKVSRPNQVWATDITYLKYKDGYVYLSAIIDLYSRKILSWGISNTQTTSWCIELLTEAMEKYGKPEVFNTDQGSQYTSKAYTALLDANGIQISMDGVGRALDNVFIERFWKTIKYEEFHLHEYQSLAEMREGIKRYIQFYNKQRFHQSLDYAAPDEKYYSRASTCFTKKRVIVPESSWLLRPRSMEKLSFEECVEIYKSGISWEEHLKVA